MTYDNPYASPLSEAVATPGSGPVTPLVLQYLRQTRPWVLFMSVLGFIGTALMVCGGVLAMLGGMAGSFAQDAGPYESGFVVGAGVVYVVMGVLYVLPSLFLWRYGRAISSLLKSEDVHDLETALLHQRSFWRYLGLLMAALLVLYLLLIAGAVVLGVMAA